MASYEFKTNCHTELLTVDAATPWTESLGFLDLPSREGVALVVDSNVRWVSDALLESASCPEAPRALWQFEGGEAAKTLEHLGRAAASFAEAGVSRKTLIIGIGGGVTTDFAAFLSAIYMRGTPCALFPTSLLAMVDAGLGGKNGVDFGPRKNLLGTIRQPEHILIATEWLKTLSDTHFRDGLAEIVKTAAVLDAEFFAELENSSDMLRERDPGTVARSITRCSQLKMQVVLDDEREAGRRMLLNFGHTIGHAWEGLSGFQLSHGQAVAMGMVAECRALQSDALSRIEALLAALNLPTEAPTQLDLDETWRLILGDKKATRGEVIATRPMTIGRGEIRRLARSEFDRVAP